jgi:hypothetical protein
VISPKNKQQIELAIAASQNSEHQGYGKQKQTHDYNVVISIQIIPDAL